MRAARTGTLAAAAVATAAMVLAIAPPAGASGAEASGGSPARDPGPVTRERAWIARVVAPTSARRKPVNGRRVTRVRPISRWTGGPVRLLVLDARVARDDRLWLRVDLPRRPNGSWGWIPADMTRLSSTPWRIEISLAKRRVTVRRRGRTFRSFRAVVGAPGTPTPAGLFAISERVRQPDPGAFIGPWALTLTAFSDVLERYGGGPGQVAIHGRSGASFADPLGTARSHGCIRVNNARVRWLARVLREGTPVRITHK